MEVLPEENIARVEPLSWSWLSKLCVRVDLDVLRQELLLVRAEVKANPHQSLLESRKMIRSRPEKALRKGYV